MYFNKREALRYFGAEAGDQRAGVAVDLAFLKLRNELQPRYTCLRLPCRVETERVVVMTAAPEVQLLLQYRLSQPLMGTKTPLRRQIRTLMLVLI